MLMKIKFLFLAAAAISAFTACQKNYTCACTDPTGQTDVFTIHESRKNAEIKCKDYYSASYDSIPLSERSCKIK